MGRTLAWRPSRALFLLAVCSCSVICTLAVLRPVVLSQLADNSTSLPAAAPSSEFGPGADLSLTSYGPNNIEHQVRSRETLASILKNYGFENSLVQSITLASAKVKAPIAALKVGEQIKLELLGGALSKLEKRLGERGHISVKVDSNGAISATFMELPVQEQRLLVSGTILSSFASAASDQGLPFSVVDEVVDLFSSRVEFRKELHPGDSFAVEFVRRVLDTGEELTPGAVISASLRTQGKLLAAVSYHGNKGPVVYFDEDGRPLGQDFLRYPLKFSRISSVFSQARFHPLLGINRPHRGVDFAAPIGTPVRSVADGVVIEAGYKSGPGRMVRIRHDERFTTEYFHLDSIRGEVRKGSHISKGQLIGGVGMSGLATGPHLHFGLFDRGTYVDPMKAKLPRMGEAGVRIPQIFLASVLTEHKHRHESVMLAQAASAPGGKF